MQTTCEEMRDWIPRALMSDLTPAEERSLNAHLADCVTCAGEQRIYIDTLSQVRSVSDVPVPKHFFVYPDERRSFFVGFLRGFTPGWKLASSLVVGTLVILAVLVAARFQFRAEQGIYSFSFGRPLPVVTPAEDPAARIEALRAELTGLLQAMSRTERTARAELMQRLRVWPTQADFQAVGISGLTPLFIAGRLGMLMDTGSEWPRIDKEAKFEWGVAAVPRQKDNKNINFINPLLLSAESKNKEAAWAFIKWNVSEAGQRLLVQNSFQPVHKGLVDEWLKGGTFKQSAADVRKAVDGAAPHSQISPNQLFVDFGPVRTAVEEGMAPTWSGERSAADGVRETKTRVDAILAESFARYGGK